MRTSNYQTQIIDFLRQHHLVSLSELSQALTADFSTLYRNVQQLEAQGEVRKLVLNSKRTVYELTSHQHDHFVCTDCQRVEAVHVRLPSLGRRTVSDVVVRGQCEACQA